MRNILLRTLRMAAAAAMLVPAAAEAGWVRCGDALRTADGGAAASLIVENATAAEMLLRKLDAKGAPLTGLALPPGARRSIPSRIGEVWVIAPPGMDCRNALRVTRDGESFQLYD